MLGLITEIWRKLNINCCFQRASVYVANNTSVLPCLRYVQDLRLVNFEVVETIKSWVSSMGRDLSGHGIYLQETLRRNPGAHQFICLHRLPPNVTWSSAKYHLNQGSKDSEIPSLHFVEGRHHVEGFCVSIEGKILKLDPWGCFEWDGEALNWPLYILKWTPLVYQSGRGWEYLQYFRRQTL